MEANADGLGPFKLCASLHETIWGGQRLRAIAGKPLPEGKRIGEAWETELDSRVVTEPYAGKSLGQMVEEYGVSLLGTRVEAIYGRRFPLLAKFIDAHDWLSVQAHPNDAYAALHEDGKLGKTEAWYILAAEPGSQIVFGFSHPTSREAVSEAVGATTLEALLQTVDVSAGDIIFVPAGTVHAIGAGVALYELQEYSDVTYRLYDYGRLQANGQPRELHVERALDVIRYKPAPFVKIEPLSSPAIAGLRSRKALVACHYFVEEELSVAGTFHLPTMPSSVQILTAIAGAAELTEPGFPPVTLTTGDTVVAPACLGATTIQGKATIIRSWVPDADDATLRAWQAAHDGRFSED